MFKNCKKLKYPNLKNELFTNEHLYSDELYGLFNNTIFVLMKIQLIAINNYNNYLTLDVQIPFVKIIGKKIKKIQASNGTCSGDYNIPIDNKFDILNKCYGACTIIFFFKGICNLEYDNWDIFIEEIINFIVRGELYELLYDKIKEEKNHIIRDNGNEIIQISSIYNQYKNGNLVTINFGEYIDSLFEEYNFDIEDNSIIIKYKKNWIIKMIIISQNMFYFLLI